MREASEKAMSSESNRTDAVEKDFTVQDGVRCPSRAPWSPRVSTLTSLTFIPIILLAFYILAQASVFKLFIWLLLFAIFAYPLRYLICARCPYYGQSCSTLYGRTVPRMFKKQEGKSMVLGLWLDVVFFLVLFLTPLPEVWRVGGFPMLLLWVGAFALMFGTVSRIACTVCPLTFCPIGRAARAVWSRSP